MLDRQSLLDLLYSIDSRFQTNAPPKLSVSRIFLDRVASLVENRSLNSNTTIANNTQSKQPLAQATDTPLNVTGVKLKARDRWFADRGWQTTKDRGKDCRSISTIEMTAQ